jgi:hypothetical protein
MTDTMRHAMCPVLLIHRVEASRPVTATLERVRSFTERSPAVTVSATRALDPPKRRTDDATHHSRPTRWFGAG